MEESGISVGVFVVVEKQLRDGGKSQGFDGLIAGFATCGRGPSVVCKKLVDVRLACDLDVGSSLSDIHTIERIEGTFIAEVDLVFFADDGH